MIDTHAHLASPQLLPDIDRYLEMAQQAGVAGILCVGTTAADSLTCVELAERYPMVRAAVGIHPNHCHEANPSDWDQITDLATHPRVVAIGETGLDRYWDDCPWEIQTKFLARHIELARQQDLPIVVHTRECMDEAILILQEHARAAQFAAVMHSFTGSAAAAQQCLELGFYISFAGMLTFKNAAEIRESAGSVPLDRILVETDSPYLTPHPLRGQKPNHPALVQLTLQCLADLRCVPLEKMDQQTTENSLGLFRRWQ